MSNSLDPDQARHFVRTDLGSKLFAKVISRLLVGKELTGCLFKGLYFFFCLLGKSTKVSLEDSNEHGVKDVTKKKKKKKKEKVNFISNDPIFSYSAVPLNAIFGVHTNVPCYK